jgi:uncharacterized protein (DUF4415 family)
MRFERAEAKSDRLSSTPGDNMAKKKSAASSQSERLKRRSEADIRAYIKSPKFKADAERSRAGGLDPSAKDPKKIPVLTPAHLNALYRPVKAPVTVRLDGDILAWLKAKGGRYQTHLNATLRNAMFAERKR